MTVSSVTLQDYVCTNTVIMFSNMHSVVFIINVPNFCYHNNNYHLNFYHVHPRKFLEAF